MAALAATNRVTMLHSSLQLILQVYRTHGAGVIYMWQVPLIQSSVGREFCGILQNATRPASLDRYTRLAVVYSVCSSAHNV